MGVWINIRVFNLIPLVHLSVFMPISNSFHYYSSIVELEVRDCDTSGSSFTVQGSFGYPGLFFHMKLSTVLSRSVQNCAGILMGIALNL